MLGKIKKVLGVLLVGVMLTPLVEGEASAEEKVVGECTLTIDADKHKGSENRAYGTGECKNGVYGWYFEEIGEFMVDGFYTQIGVKDGEKYKVAVTSKGEHEVTVRLVHPIEEDKEKIELPVKPIEIKADSKEVKGVKEQKKEKENKVVKKEEEKESELKIYTVDELKELREEGRVGFNAVDLRYFVIVDDLLEQEISEEDAIELGYLEELELPEEIEYDEDIGESEIDGEVKKFKIQENKGSNSIVLVIGIVLVGIIGIVYLYVTRQGNKKE